jgi:hypothetical protein
MMKFGSVALAGCLLAFVSTTHSLPAQAQKLRDTGYCKLQNVKVGKTIYQGDCRITQEEKDFGPLITVKLGEAQSMKFACQRNGSCLTGPTNVQLRDRGNGTATFRWEDFQLDVDADKGGQAAAQPLPGQPPKLRDTGYCVLENVKVGKRIYQGDCRITQEEKDYGPLITVKLGEAQAFKFACQRNGSCLTGPTDVQLRDRGNGSATFRWEDFRLDVDADKR